MIECLNYMLKYQLIRNKHLINKLLDNNTKQSRILLKKLKMKQTIYRN